jgi:beta-glucosidase
VQVYVSDLVASITPSVKRLRGFDKITLKAGETKTVKISVPVASLAFINKNNKWVVEPGEFVISVHNMKQTILVK